MRKSCTFLGLSLLGASLGGCHTVSPNDPFPEAPSVGARYPRPARPDRFDSDLGYSSVSKSRRTDRAARQELDFDNPREPSGALRLVGDESEEPAGKSPRDVPRPPESTTRSPRSADGAQGPKVVHDATAHRAALEYYEECGLRNNPAVSEAQARVSALRGKWLQAGLSPNPTAGYAASEVGNEGNAGQQGVYLGQEIVTGGKLQLNRAVVSQEVRRAQQELAAQRQRVLTDVRISYYEVLIAQRRLELAQSLLETTTRAAEAVEKLLKAKEATKPELLQAQVEADNARLLAQNAATIHAAAWRRLAAVVGCPENAPVTLAGDVEATPAPIDWNDARHRVLSESPQLAAALAGVDRSRWAISQARAQVVPNIDLQHTVQRDDTTRYTIAGIQATIAVPVFNRNQGGIRQAQSELVASQRAFERVELSLERKLALTYQRYRVAQQQSDQYSREILPKIRDTLNLVNKGYEGGEVSFVQLLTAQRSYVQTNLTYLDSLRDLWTAYFEIEGMLLRDSLDQGSSNE